MKRVLLLSSLALTGIFASCGDDKEDPKPKTKSELLMAKSWMLTAETEATGTAAPVNSFDRNYTSYEKDNIYKFLANNKFVSEEGATRENPSDPSSTEGAWSLSDSDKKIIYQAGFFGTGLLSSDQKGEIEELTETKLVVKMTDADGSSPTVITRQTFTAK